LEGDAGKLYGATGRRAAEQFRRNPGRFPDGSVFRPTREEWKGLLAQFAEARAGKPPETPKRGGRRQPPLAFAPEGLLALGAVLRPPDAQAAALCGPMALCALVRGLQKYPYLEHRLDEVEAELPPNAAVVFKMVRTMLKPDSDLTSAQVGDAPSGDSA